MLHKAVMFATPADALPCWLWCSDPDGEDSRVRGLAANSVQQPEPKSCWQPPEFKNESFPSHALRLAQSLGQLGCSLMRTGSGRPS